MRGNGGWRGEDGDRVDEREWRMDGHGIDEREWKMER